MVIKLQKFHLATPSFTYSWVNMKNKLKFIIGLQIIKVSSLYSIL